MLAPWCPTREATGAGEAQGEGENPKGTGSHQCRRRGRSCSSRPPNPTPPQPGGFSRPRPPKAGAWDGPGGEAAGGLALGPGPSGGYCSSPAFKRLSCVGCAHQATRSRGNGAAGRTSSCPTQSVPAQVPPPGPPVKPLRTPSAQDSRASGRPGGRAGATSAEFQATEGYFCRRTHTGFTECAEVMPPKIRVSSWLCKLNDDIQVRD